MRRKAFSIWKLTAVAGLLLSACGKADDLPSDVASSLSSGLSSSVKTSASAPSDDEIKAAIPKILLGLEEIKQEIKGLQKSAITPVSTTSAAKPGTTTSKPATGTTGTSKPATTSGSGTTTSSSTGSASGSTAPKPAAPSATEELKKMLQDMSTKPFVEAVVEKNEKSLKDGHVTSGKLNMFTKAPNLVKVDVTFASTGATGAKVLYTSGEGAKAKIRPGGSLSFITTELAKTDDRLTSTNDYKLDDIDLFGLARRLSSGYSAELVGKSQVNGIELYILKVKAQGTNSLDARIDYEYLGYEPDSHKLRLWEVYTADSKEPFFRMALTKLEYPDNIPDSTFKL